MSNWRIPKIPKREFDEQFFTFITPDENTGGVLNHFRWRTEPRLHQNVISQRQHNEDFEQFFQDKNAASLVEYFLNLCQDDFNSIPTQNIARWHLTAYLEKPCYQAVTERFYAFRDFQNQQNTWEHYLHVGQTLTNNPHTLSQIYRKYQEKSNEPNNSEVSNLESHFKWHLVNLIRDIIQQQTGQGKYSPWYSLKKASSAQLTQRLIALGIHETQISPYLNAKESLFEVYSKSGRRWLKPTPQQYRDATQFYQHHYSSLTVEQFQQLVLTCLRALQSSPSINYVGADIERYCVETNRQEEIALAEPLFTLEEEQTEQKIHNTLEELNQLLAQEVETFQAEESKGEMLLLHLGLTLSGSSIANYLRMSQSTVSRTLPRLHRQLLKKAAIWAKERFDLDIKALAAVEAYIAGWVQQQYEERVDRAIAHDFTNTLNPAARELLSAKYFQGLSPAQIARQRNCTPKEIAAQFLEAKAQLQANLLNWVQTNTGITLADNRDIKRIERRIEQWLTQKSST